MPPDNHAPQPPSAVPPANPPVNKWAVTGLLVTCLAPLLAPLGLIFSIMGLRRAKADRGAGRGLAIAGIIVSSVFTVLVPLVVLSFVIRAIPDLQRAERNTLRQTDVLTIMDALADYASRHQSVLPPSKDSLVDRNNRFDFGDHRLEIYNDAVFYDVKPTAAADESYYGETTEVNKGLSGANAELPDEDNVHIWVGWQCLDNDDIRDTTNSGQYNVGNFQPTSERAYTIVYAVEDDKLRCNNFEPR